MSWTGPIRKRFQTLRIGGEDHAIPDVSGIVEIHAVPENTPSRRHGVTALEYKIKLAFATYALFRYTAIKQGLAPSPLHSLN